MNEESIQSITIDGREWLTPAQARDAIGLSKKSKQVSEARKRGRMVFRWDDVRGCYLYELESVRRYAKGRALLPTRKPRAEITQLAGRRDNDCRVYILEAVGTDRFKVGSSIDPDSRTRNISVACPFPVALRYVIEGRRGDEREAHAELADQHAHGEWFHGPMAAIVDAVNKAVARTARVGSEGRFY
jgi:hypothetical protein